MTCQGHISSVADYKWSFQLMSETVSQRNNLVKLKQQQQLKSLTQSLAFLVQHNLFGKPETQDQKHL